METTSIKMTGINHPYTFKDFGMLIIDIAKNKKYPEFSILDYFLASATGQAEYTTIKERDGGDIFFTVKYGCEGIYADFFFDEGYEGERYHFATAKTLLETREAYVKMSCLAANVVCDAMEYIEGHTDEFQWTGFEIGYKDEDGKERYEWHSSTEEGVKKFADKVRKAHPGKPILIKDFEDRKIKIYER